MTHDRRQDQAARRWARKAALAFPGTIFTAQIRGQSLSYFYEGGPHGGLMYTRGLQHNFKPYVPHERR